MTNKEQEFLVQKIRTQYTEKEYTQLDALRDLDAKVKRPAIIWGSTLLTLGALIMGTGMSLVMTDLGKMIGIGNSMVYGVVIGVIGMLVAGLAYPAYTKILNSRRKKYSKEIIKLSDDIMKG